MIKKVQDDVLVIGITGVIGSGKSTVCRIISEKGYPIISSDENAKILMKSDLKVRQRMVKHFGVDVYDYEGNLNRGYLSELVFGIGKESQSKLSTLNSIVHPSVIELMIKQVEEKINEGEKLIFVESALMFETGTYEGFDYIIVVDASEEVCIQRAIERNSITREQVISRQKNQYSAQKKKQMADFIIENNGTMENLSSSVDFILGIISKLPPKNFDQE